MQHAGGHDDECRILPVGAGWRVCRQSGCRTIRRLRCFALGVVYDEISVHISVSCTHYIALRLPFTLSLRTCSWVPLPHASTATTCLIKRLGTLSSVRYLGDAFFTCGQSAPRVGRDPFLLQPTLAWASRRGGCRYSPPMALAISSLLDPKRSPHDPFCLSASHFGRPEPATPCQCALLLVDKHPTMIRESTFAHISNVLLQYPTW